MSTKQEGIIFDFNGVLVDDYEIQKAAWDKISLVLRQKPVTDLEMLEKIRGLPTRDTIKWMSPKRLSEKALLDLAARRTKIASNFVETSNDYKLAAGLEIFLNDLKQRNIPRTIATSQTLDALTKTFKSLRLERWFDFDKIVYFDGSYPGKPEPDVYLKAARKINLNPGDCYIVEDALSGMKAAYSAGSRNIIAVAKKNMPIKQPGIINSIHDFTEITVDELF